MCDSLNGGGPLTNTERTGVPTNTVGSDDSTPTRVSGSGDGGSGSSGSASTGSSGSGSPNNQYEEQSGNNSGNTNGVSTLFAFFMLGISALTVGM